MQIKGRLTAGFLADGFFSKRFICKGLRVRLGSLLAFFEIEFGVVFVPHLWLKSGRSDWLGCGDG